MSRTEDRIMNRAARLFMAVVILAVVTSCRDESPLTPADSAQSGTAATNTIQDDTVENRTPLQRALMQDIAQRQADGLPVPSVSFEYSSRPGAPVSDPGKQGSTRGRDVAIDATTVVHFDGPAQAGLDRWPAFVIRGSISPGAVGFIHEGDYSQNRQRRY